MPIADIVTVVGAPKNLLDHMQMAEQAAQRNDQRPLQGCQMLIREEAPSSTLDTRERSSRTIPSDAVLLGHPPAQYVPDKASHLQPYHAIPTPLNVPIVIPYARCLITAMKCTKCQAIMARCMKDIMELLSALLQRGYKGDALYRSAAHTHRYCCRMACHCALPHTA